MRFRIINEFLAYVFAGFYLLHYPTDLFADSGVDVTLEGGETTVDDASIKAFNHILANITDSAIQDQHDAGDTGFLRNFRQVKIKGKIRLGPQFNNISCVGCHANEGRGLPGFGRTGSESVVKISQTKGKPQVRGGPIPVSGFGTQIHDHALKGTTPDAKLKIRWTLVNGAYPDGTPYELRKPRLTIRPAKGKKLSKKVMTSIRRAPPVFGAGLLEAIDEATMRTLEAQQEQAGAGISGRPNVVWNLTSKNTSVGKFGFKAAAPSLVQQIANAYSTDMGVTNPLVRLGDKHPEIPQRILSSTTFYVQTLAVPRARNQDSLNVIHGKDLFQSVGCSSCHVMTITTGQASLPQLSSQTIHPFTDLLLHDMGSGLADNRPEFEASGTEWKTAPLWGIGLTPITISGGAPSYLHDGRARTLEEAILWHGGEAQNANTQFQSLSSADRSDLITFLQSL